MRKYNLHMSKVCGFRRVYEWYGDVLRMSWEGVCLVLVSPFHCVCVLSVLFVEGGKICE